MRKVEHFDGAIGASEQIPVESFEVNNAVRSYAKCHTECASYAFDSVPHHIGCDLVVAASTKFRCKDKSAVIKQRIDEPKERNRDIPSRYANEPLKHVHVDDANRVWKRGAYFRDGSVAEEHVDQALGRVTSVKIVPLVSFWERVTISSVHERYYAFGWVDTFLLNQYGGRQLLRRNQIDRHIPRRGAAMLERGARDRSKVQSGPDPIRWTGCVARSG